ncbi:MAG: alpha/beta hydrolase [Cyanobacteriota bacterium]|nr:alpha/beta hydrolase [Cyanobacteriota bacterium]
MAARSLFWSRALFLGTGASLLCLGTPASAAQWIVLQYNEEEIPVSIADLENFALTGSFPELQQFLEGEAEFIESSVEEVMSLIQDGLTAELDISPQLQDGVEGFLNSPAGDFVLVQLKQILVGSEERGDLQFIRAAVERSIEDDNAISVLELIDRHPLKALYFDASGLTGIVNEITEFLGEEPATEPAAEPATEPTAEPVTEPNPKSLSDR